MRCRKNVRSLTLGEKDAFVQAIEALKGEPSLLHPGSQSRYDDFVEVHLGAMNAAIIGPGNVLIDPGWAHFDSAFFPWHRELLFRFEDELRAQVPGVTIPYWDWTREQAIADLGFPFKHSFIGVDGNNANSDRVEREAGAPSPYPYEFDPDTWTIEVKDNPGPGGEPDFLTRDFGSRGDAPNLPLNTGTVTGVNSSFLQAIGAASYLDLRARSEDIHNLVHRWVVGNMITASSPNDPVFWMHHAAIDRMWTIWQQKNPAITPYVHVNGFSGHGLNDTLIFNEPGDPVPWAGAGTPNQVTDSHALHGESVWYESDLPDIVLESANLVDFGAVPQGMTQYRAVRFRIRTCRPVVFRIAGVPTGSFGLTTLGADFPVSPDPSAEWADAFVWIQFQASGASPQASGLSIEAFLVDEEGYYAATEGGTHPLGNWSFTLEATIQPREDAAVVLVLDRSYSMSASAAGGNTRSGLMKSALGVFHALLLPNEEFGVVSFDDVTENLLPLTTQSAGLGTTLTGTGLDPRGNTGIGLGIQAASAMLSSASHSNTSMLVLTDGNENVHPYVDELPAGTVTNRTYAIGFGLPGHVSDDVLNRITDNTGGDLVISGSLDSEQERFRLTKYFVQMLSGVTSANVILDPEGKLRWGETQTVAFQVADADISIDVIALCPVAPILRFRVHAPDGTVIDPGVAGSEPNVSFHVHEQVAFFRIDLPALPGKVNTHAGTWVAEFQVADADDVKKWLAEHDTPVSGLSEILRGRALPYSCIVHTRSNIDLRASVQQKSLEPGAPFVLTAKLSEYGVPFTGSASVWANVTRPDGQTDKIHLVDQGNGELEETFTAQKAGLYRFRIQAAGQSIGGHPFTREKTLSRGVFAGGDRVRSDDIIGRLDERDRRFCALLDCILENVLSDRSAQERLKNMGVDPVAIRKCLQNYCARREADERGNGRGEGRSDGSAELDKAFTLMRQELLKIDPERLFDKAPETVDRTAQIEERARELEALRSQRGAKTAHHAGFMLQPIEPHDKGGLPKGLSLSKAEKGRRKRK